MNTKMRWKIAIDVVMSILLLFLMAYQVIGEFWHEVCGTAMLVLFLVHHILNLRWYKSLLKEKYTLQRVISIVLNAALLAAMLSLAYSGVVLSRHVFDFLPITSGMALARVMHLSASYWGFVLMSLHIGLHWGMMVGMFHRITGGKRSLALAWIARFLAVAIAIYGAVCFRHADIFSYMFVKVEFVFFDYEKSAAQVFAEHIAMMGTWIFTGYYVQKGIGRLARLEKKWRITNMSEKQYRPQGGRGYYQEWGKEAVEMEPGSVVNIPAEVKHWHGAAPDLWFSHLAWEVPGEESSNEWCEPVSEEEYGKLK